MSLLGLVVAVLVIGFLFWLIDQAPISEPFKTIAKGICVFVLVIYLVYFVAGLLGEGPPLVLPPRGRLP